MVKYQEPKMEIIYFGSVTIITESNKLYEEWDSTGGDTGSLGWDQVNQITDTGHGS